VRLEPLVEVVRAHARDDNGEHEENNGERGKSGERLLGWLVFLLAVEAGNVHADELEEEVAQGDEVDDDDGDHAGDGFAADPPGGEEEQEEGDDEGDGGEGRLNCARVLDDDEELYGEGEEEEEVELEEGDVDLGMLVMVVWVDMG